jgi:uncharacterized membrane protein
MSERLKMCERFKVSLTVSAHLTRCLWSSDRVSQLTHTNCSIASASELVCGKMQSFFARQRRSCCALAPQERCSDSSKVTHEGYSWSIVPNKLSLSLSLLSKDVLLDGRNRASTYRCTYILMQASSGLMFPSTRLLYTSTLYSESSVDPVCSHHSASQDTLRNCTLQNYWWNHDARLISKYVLAIQHLLTTSVSHHSVRVFL